MKAGTCILFGCIAYRLQEDEIRLYNVDRTKVLVCFRAENRSVKPWREEWGSYVAAPEAMVQEVECDMEEVPWEAISMNQVNYLIGKEVP